MPETTQNGAEGRSEVREEGVLSNMEVFTIDLRRGIIVFIMHGAAITYF